MDVGLLTTFLAFYELYGSGLLEPTHKKVGSRKPSSAVYCDFSEPSDNSRDLNLRQKRRRDAAKRAKRARRRNRRNKK
jgi:hypothetical protein